MEHIGVDCTISADGKVQIRRINIKNEWLEVIQGRQWEDQDGRHVLILIASSESNHLIFRRETLKWELHSNRSSKMQFV
jgi:hypothetical protein